MRCPECVAVGQKSRVFDHGGRKTLMGHTPYFDEEGVRHSHDGNVATYFYTCSNGHEFVERSRSRCPAPGCDFGGPVEDSE